MVSTACYPYPVNETTRRSDMRPYIYSPSESHASPRHIMYPHHQSPSPNYIYTGYDQYYSKNNWASAAWPVYYPYPLSSSLPETTVNPKVTILPPQPALVSDIDTPSSLSSHSSSPFARHDVDEESMDFDEFDDDEDYIDSDFADEMEGIDESDLDAFVYGTTAPHTKSTSALEGALGDTLPADRRLSASVPYPSASRSRPSSSPAHVYTRNHASVTSLTSPYAASLSAPPRLPILQPQPIRPIPRIPIAELASADDVLPLLCQPVSDAIRYQLDSGLGRAPTPSDLAHHGTFCQTDGTCSVGKTVYSCGYVGWR